MILLTSVLHADKTIHVYFFTLPTPLAGPPVSQGGGLRPSGPGGRSDARGGLTISGDSPLRKGGKLTT